MRIAYINLRVSSEQRYLIDRAAKVLGKSRSDFMLEVARERAQVVLPDQIFFDLDSNKFLSLNGMLDAPAPSNSGLES